MIKIFGLKSWSVPGTRKGCARPARHLDSAWNTSSNIISPVLSSCSTNKISPPWCIRKVSHINVQLIRHWNDEKIQRIREMLDIIDVRPINSITDFFLHVASSKSNRILPQFLWKDWGLARWWSGTFGPGRWLERKASAYAGTRWGKNLAAIL